MALNLKRNSLMIELVIAYLRQIRYFDVKEDFKDLFHSHPNYPSVFAITDTFDTLGIENAALKIPKEQLSELPEIFLAICNEKMVLVTKKGNSLQTETSEGTKRQLTHEQFLSEWEGVVILAEPAEKTVQPQVSTIGPWLKYALPVGALVLIAVLNNGSGPNSLFMLAPTIIGLLAGIFIIQEKFGVKNEAVSKLCNINPKASCDSVIKSNSGAISKWLSFTDLPLVFFSINLLAILLEPGYSTILISGISLLSLPVIAYSIWLQKYRIKHWCMLCLLVSLVLVFQASGWFFMKMSMQVPISGFYSYLFAAILVSAVWALLKPVLEGKMESEKALNDAIKFKRNYELFQFLSKDIAVPSGFEKLKGIRFGNNEAPVQLTLFLSPSCGHCHQAVKDVFQLMEKYPEKIGLQTCFNLNPDNTENVYRVVAEQLLLIGQTHPEEIKQAISDWHISEMGLDQWKSKWQTDIVDMAANHQLYLQYEWCLANEFNYAPVKIINGKMFPAAYELKDLKYFFNHFSEENEPHAVLQFAHA